MVLSYGQPIARKSLLIAVIAKESHLGRFGPYRNKKNRQQIFLIPVLNFPNSANFADFRN
jgi:hypothetical protein